VQAKVVSQFREIRGPDGNPIDFMSAGQPLLIAGI